MAEIHRHSNPAEFAESSRSVTEFSRTDPSEAPVSGPDASEPVPVHDAPAEPVIVRGITAGVPFVARAPLGDPERTAPVIVLLHGFDPPLSAEAFSAILPLDRLDAWRIALDLPMFGARAVPVDEIVRRSTEDFLLQLLGPVIEQATAELPMAVAELRVQLPIEAGPIGLVGFSAGGLAALLAATVDGGVPVDALALVAPVLNGDRLIAALEKLYQTPYTWTDMSRNAVEQWRGVHRAGVLTEKHIPTLVVATDSDPYVTPDDIAGFLEPLGPGGRFELFAGEGHGFADELDETVAPAPSERAALIGSLIERWWPARQRPSV